MPCESHVITCHVCTLPSPAAACSCQMVIDFGYVVLFAGAMPLAAALTVLSNLVEAAKLMGSLQVYGVGRAQMRVVTCAYAIACLH